MSILDNKIIQGGKVIKIVNKIIILVSLSLVVSCKGIIKDHELTIKENQIISTTIFDEKFGLPFSGSFPVIIKDIYYGEIGLAPKTANDDFSVSIISDLSSFNSDVWDGFGPITTLPNGSGFPQWVGADELIQISIPTFTELFAIQILFGLDNDRFYVGLDLNIDAVDEIYPEGLNISQEVKNKKSPYPFAAIYVYGPVFDQDREKLQNGGMTILTSFKKPAQ